MTRLRATTTRTWVRPRAHARGPAPLRAHVRGQEPGAGAGLRPGRVPRPAGREGHQGRGGRFGRRHGEAARAKGLDVVRRRRVAFLHASPPPGPTRGCSAPTSSSTSPPTRSGSSGRGPAGARPRRPVRGRHPQPGLLRGPQPRLLARPDPRPLLRPAPARVPVPPGRPRGRVERHQPGQPPRPAAGVPCPEPVVHPPLDDLVERAMGKLGASLDHRDRKGRVTTTARPGVGVRAGPRGQGAGRPAPGDHRGPPGGPQGPRQAGGGLYQSNETYVVARG